MVQTGCSCRGQEWRVDWLSREQRIYADAGCQLEGLSELLHHRLQTAQGVHMLVSIFGHGIIAFLPASTANK